MNTSGRSAERECAKENLCGKRRKKSCGKGSRSSAERDVCVCVCAWCVLRVVHKAFYGSWTLCSVLCKRFTLIREPNDFVGLCPAK